MQPATAKLTRIGPAIEKGKHDASGDQWILEGNPGVEGGDQETFILPTGCRVATFIVMDLGGGREDVVEVTSFWNERTKTVHPQLVIQPEMPILDRAG
ncbi:hypothetical protein [Aurantimonas sp. 22II-16-19i]|uniref:hypothetical protein n=1 Tax=Aurantimonas sp. 22II-16-19i TaxID=1317114 RepID=UPI0009F7DDAF|nr:hypothetical protein [Aurantimonas sp. 22II-16-19i]ORE87830.1 hypothetical protein ATO4_25103 [Aurantimonas sp. 22II-16-19i]